MTCAVPSYLRPVQYLILLLNLCFMCKELFQACLDYSAYIRQWENWLQILIIIGVFLCTVRKLNVDNVPKFSILRWKHSSYIKLIFKVPTWYMEDGVAKSTSNWQHDVAAITIFFCWLELMMIIGRFPTFGLYVQMFTTGSIVLLNVMLRKLKTAHQSSFNEILFRLDR